jgi:hypothetical protein
MASAIGAAKVKAVATAARARGAGIGNALIQCCNQVYFRCCYVMIYGQMPGVPGLDAFYRRNGFDVLDVGDELDMWVVFGVHFRIRTDPGERFFIWQVPAASR